MIPHDRRVLPTGLRPAGTSDSVCLATNGAGTKKAASFPAKGKEAARIRPFECPYAAMAVASLETDTRSGRSSDLFHPRGPSREVLPVARVARAIRGTHGGGTAPDLHGIPYSPLFEAPDFVMLFYVLRRVKKIDFPGFRQRRAAKAMWGYRPAGPKRLFSSRLIFQGKYTRASIALHKTRARFYCGRHRREADLVWRSRMGRMYVFCG